MFAEIVEKSMARNILNNRRQRPIILVVFNENNRGPIVLYEILLQHGYAAKFIYYLHDNQENRQALKNFVLTHNAMMLGFSFASQSVAIAHELADYFHREYPGMPVIFGGVHPTVDPLSCVDHCEALCIGEGEQTLLEVAQKLVDGEDYLVAKNLVYKKNGRVVQNPVNPLVPDLDALPIRRPYSSDHFTVEKGKIIPVDSNKYYELLPSELTCYTQIFSRGCPYKCSYCGNSRFQEIYPGWPRIRSKSVTATIEEICENIKLNPQIIRVFIIDDCFLAHDISWLRDFVAQWQEKVRKEFSFFTIPEYITTEKMEALKLIKPRYCSTGLQSGSKKTNVLYNRRFSADSFLRACRLLHSLDIRLVVDVILDNPLEDDEDFMQTLDILTRIDKPFYLTQYSLKVFPGTKLFDFFRANNIKIPEINLSFGNFGAIRTTDVNRIMVLTQMLPRRIIFYLFKQRQKAIVKYLIRVLYFLSCMIMPFHALYVCGARSIRHNLAIAFSCRRLAVQLVKGLLGSAK